MEIKLTIIIITVVAIFFKLGFSTTLAVSGLYIVNDKGGRNSWWNENWKGKPKYSEKTLTTATPSATNSTLSDLRCNPGPRG
jgi:hypothetical protein